MKRSILMIVGFFAVIALILTSANIFGNKRIDRYPSDSLEKPTEGSSATDKPDEGEQPDVNEDQGSEQPITKPSDGIDNDTSDSVVTPHVQYFREGDIGYITKGGITTFFVAASAPEDLSLENDCYEMWNLYYLLENVKVYDNAVLAHKYSLDGGATWTDFYTTNGSSYNMKVDGVFVYAPISTKIWIAYTQIQNCSNPTEYLTCLRENVFNKKLTNSVHCMWCGGSYGTYEDFCWIASHEKRVSQDF